MPLRAENGAKFIKINGMPDFMAIDQNGNLWVLVDKHNNLFRLKLSEGEDLKMLQMTKSIDVQFLSGQYERYLLVDSENYIYLKGVFTKEFWFNGKIDNLWITGSANFPGVAGGDPNNFERGESIRYFMGDVDQVACGVPML